MSGPRIVDSTRVHFIIETIPGGPNVIVVAIAEIMLPSFYTDLVQDCNSWQISISYSRHVQILVLLVQTRKICSTLGAIQLKKVSKIFNRSMHNQRLLWIRQCRGRGMSPMSFSTNSLIQSSSIKGVPLHLRMKFQTNPSLRAVSVGSYIYTHLISDVF